jgi:subtilase family serine protease
MINPFETEINGRWEEHDGTIVGDAASKRIDKLIESELKFIARSEDGWSALYTDLNDGRFWELTYPNSDWHGGGPRSLRNISDNEAKKSTYLMTRDKFRLA